MGGGMGGGMDIRGLIESLTLLSQRLNARVGFEFARVGGYQYIYCLPPAGGRIRSQGNDYCLPPAGGRIRSQGN